jgi:g-D-glutamyl-meso-diaminopimelate peptidase
MKRRLIILLTICLFLPVFPKEFRAESIIDASKVYTYEDFQDDVWILKSKYKKQLQVHTIGKSEFGRKIYAIQIGQGEKSVLLSGAHHGREWITSLLTMKMAEDIAVNMKNGDNFLGSYSIWIVPMINPDGVTIQQGRINKFPFFSKRKIKKMNDDSKDFTRWKSNGLGVDLNRQYPAGWENLKNSKKEPSYKNYKGKAPFEAKEVQAIVELTDKIKPTIAVAYHSSGQEIFWQYNNGVNEKRDRTIAEILAQETGYQLGIPPKDAIGGGFTDWFITTYHLPAFTIEICPLVNERNPSLTNFAEAWGRNKTIPKTLVEEAKKIDAIHKKLLGDK